MIRQAFLFLAIAASAGAQGWPLALAQDFQSRQAADDSDYQNGLRQLDARQWDQAIASFAAASRKNPNADAALYWKAYAQNRVGRRVEALATVSDLRRSYPASRWGKDAQVLEMEVRAQTGDPVSPNAQPDEDLKLMAVNSLMQSDPNQALPILQHLLSSNNSEKLKERALFVLTQNSSPQARKLLADTARGSSNPGLQMKAIRYMGMTGNADARAELASIYSSSSDLGLKREILRSFMQSGSRDFLLNAAKTEQNPELRRDAIRQLAISGGQEELWQLYRGSSSEDKKSILESMFIGGNAGKLAEIAQTEKEPALKVAAIKSLGLMGGGGRGEVLVSIYRSDQDRDVRHAVLNSLFLQQNGKALVELARSEKNPEMREDIVRKMSLVHSKEVTDYMMEILK